MSFFPTPSARYLVVNILQSDSFGSRAHLAYRVLSSWKISPLTSDSETIAISKDRLETSPHEILIPQVVSIGHASHEGCHVQRVRDV